MCILLKNKGLGSLFLIGILIGCHPVKQEKARRPNILLAISDDQSFAHTSYAGCSFAQTPAFDRVAREGLYFTNCIAGSPGCAPSRSSIVTGRYPWQNEQSGQHASCWLKKYVPFVDLLALNGYHTGMTGKGVAPFQYARSEEDSLWRKTDAAGVSYSDIRYAKGSVTDERFADGISDINYFENFKQFIAQRTNGQPFFFWYGAKEPHRSYEEGSWKRNGKKLEEVKVPGFLPDNNIIRGDLLDYAVEIEWFDLHLQRMLDYLEKIGELDNTMVIVTSDNGMCFPRAKATCYEYGIHVPLAIRFPKEIPEGKVIEEPVSFIDFAPTILDMTGTSSNGMQPIMGKSMRPTFESVKKGEKREKQHEVFTGRERHSSARYMNWGYPQRALRSNDYLLIWNQKAERWPLGAPQSITPGTAKKDWPSSEINDNAVLIPEKAFYDLDDSPTKAFLIENRQDKKIWPYFIKAVGKHPEFELYNVKKDPYCLNDLEWKDEFKDIEETLKRSLMQRLIESSDPRMVGPDKEVFDSYPRFFPVREFPKPD